jgi:nitroreductase
MDVFECIETRRSVRKYGTGGIPLDKVVQILDAGTDAPSAGNVQPWEFIVITDEKVKDEIYNVSLSQEHIKKAPVLIAVLANRKKASLRYGKRGRDFYCIQDTAACVQNMLLAAHALGIGACWVGAFDDIRLSAALGITDDEIKPVAIITLGEPIPYETSQKPERVEMDKITWAERYGDRPRWILPYQRKHRFSYEPLGERAEKLVGDINAKVSEIGKPAEKQAETKDNPPAKRKFFDIFRKGT